MTTKHDRDSNERVTARDALLNEISAEVEKIDQADHQVNRIAVLKSLAESYALVVHGTKLQAPAKS